MAENETLSPQPAQQSEGKTISISKRAIVMALAVTFSIVIIAVVLSQVLPMGRYGYVMGEDGQYTDSLQAGSFVEGYDYEGNELHRLSWWQYLLSPVLILIEDGAATLWGILVLLLVIGAVFTALDETGVMLYAVKYIASKFRRRKYALLFVLSLFFMVMGSSAGMFEEFIPMIPVVVLLCYAMGWDALTGLAISVLSSCCGFAAGVVNPFTVGICQSLAPESMNMVMYSGIGMRLLTFVLVYLALDGIIFAYVRRIEKDPTRSLVYEADKQRRGQFNFNLDEFRENPSQNKSLVWFAAWLGFIVLFALVAIALSISGAVPGIANSIMYVTIAAYAIAGIGACILSGLKGKALLKSLGKGTLTLLPATAMILIAGAVRYILEEGNVMHTILHYAETAIGGQPKFVIVLILYAVIIFFNGLIPSGSGKAFLLMPMVFALCSMFGIDGQIAVLTFAYADGFSNMILPTNAGLLLMLGMTTVDYPKWVRWSGKIQLVILAITIGLLALATLVVYA